MKWYVLKDSTTNNDIKYEYESYGLYTDGWYLHLYVEEGTELHDIVKTFTDDDMFDLNCYLLYKEYGIPFESTDGMTFAKMHEINNEFIQNVLTDFVYGITDQEDSVKDDLLSINEVWDEGDINISIHKNRVGDTEVEVSSYNLNSNVTGSVLLDNLGLVVGEDFSRFNYVRATRIEYDNSSQGNLIVKSSLIGLINVWDEDSLKEVVSISKVLADNGDKSDQLFITVMNKAEGYKVENFVVRGKVLELGMEL